MGGAKFLQQFRQLFRCMTLALNSNGCVFVNNLDWGPVPRFAPWKHCSHCGLLYDSQFSKRSYFGRQVSLASTTRGTPLAARERRNYGREMVAKWCLGFFYMPQICDMRPIILLPFKNPTAWAGFEPANLGIRGQHATTAPPKPLNGRVTFNLLVKQVCTGNPEDQETAMFRNVVNYFLVYVSSHSRRSTFQVQFNCKFRIISPNNGRSSNRT